MPHPLPILDDIVIDTLGITLVDQRTDDAGGITGRKILVDVLSRTLLNSIRPNTILCADGTEGSDRISRLWVKARDKRPGLGYQEFIDDKTNVIVRDDSDCDPRLSILTFIVFDGDRTNLGLFTLYNIEIEEDDPTKITANAMAMPGCHAASGSTVRETWSGIMRWILLNNFGGDQAVDFIEWRFPTRASHQWVLTPAEAKKQGDGMTDAISDRIVKDLEDINNVDVIRGSDNVPEKARRRAPGV